MTSPAPLLTTTEQLRSLLHAVRAAAGNGFSGAGLIVSSEANALPIMPLRSAWFEEVSGSLIERLAAISTVANDLHDGFHLLTPAFELTCVSLYFSPPIVSGLAPPSERTVGGRYWAARFGSLLPGVLATGVASNSYGVAIFERGEEVA